MHFDFHIACDEDGYFFYRHSINFLWMNLATKMLDMLCRLWCMVFLDIFWLNTFFQLIFSTRFLWGLRRSTHRLALSCFHRIDGSFNEGFKKSSILLSNCNPLIRKFIFKQKKTRYQWLSNKNLDMVAAINYVNYVNDPKIFP